MKEHFKPPPNQISENLPTGRMVPPSAPYEEEVLLIPIQPDEPVVAMAAPMLSPRNQPEPDMSPPSPVTLSGTMSPHFEDYSNLRLDRWSPFESSLHNSSPEMPWIEPDDVRGEFQENRENDPEKRRMVASGVASAVLGSLVLGSSYLGAVVGFGSAYFTKQSGAAGDIARAIGDVALITRAKAVEIDHKHQLVQKSKRAAADAWEYAKELDRRHHIVSKTKDFVLFSWRESVSFSRRHSLLERGGEAVGRGLMWLVSKASLLKRNNQDEQGESETSSRSRPTTLARTY